MLKKIKEAIYKREEEFSNKSKKHQQTIIKKNMFGFLSYITGFGMVLSFIGILLFFNPQVTEKLFIEKQEITETAPNYLVEDFKNFKENTIFKRKDILEYKVSKEEFYTAMMNKFENEMLERKRKSEEIKEFLEEEKEEIKEYLKYEEEKLEQNLSLVEEGLFFIIENDNYKELIATDKNGFVSFYHKKIKKLSTKENNEYLTKIENFSDYERREYKNFRVGKIKINNKDIFEVEISSSVIKPFTEMRDNYLKSKFTEEEFYSSLTKLMNGLKYESINGELNNIFYFDSNIQDAFNGQNDLVKNLKNSLNEAIEEANAQIDKAIFFNFLNFLFCLFFLYGYKKEKKLLKEFEIEEKQLLKSNIDKELKNKEEVKVEVIKI